MISSRKFADFPPEEEKAPPIRPQGEPSAAKNADAAAISPFPAQPRNALEAHLLEIWTEVLGSTHIGTDDSFFTIGGDDRLADLLLARIDERLNARIEHCTLFRQPTIRDLAAHILRTQQRQAARNPFVPFHTEGKKTPVFFFHGDYVGGGFFCKNLAEQIGPNRPFYAVHPHGLLGDVPPHSIEAMARDRLSAIRAIQPRGPYLLGGYCNGALVAFEMARILQAKGEKVETLLMLMADGSSYRRRLLHSLCRVSSALRRETEPARQRRFLTWINRIDFVQGVFSHYTSAALDILRRPFPHGAKRIARKLGRVIQRLRGVSSKEIAEPGALQPIDVGDAFSAAFLDFIPKPYAGKITLLWPEAQPAEPGCPKTYGWSAVCPNVELQHVPGEHHSCVAEPSHVRSIGLAMRKVLDIANPS